MSSGIRIAALLLLLPALAACPEASPATAEASSSKASVTPEPAPSTADAPADALAEPVPAPEPERKVSSGLDLGMQATPFESCGLDSDPPSCAPTDTKGPLVLAHGRLEDEAFVELLLNLQAVQRRYKPDQLRVLALTSEDPATLAQRREELSKLRRLELELRRVDPADEVWSEHYRVTEASTVMFVDAESAVRYSQVAPDVLDTLDQAIVAAGVAVDIAKRGETTN